MSKIKKSISVLGATGSIGTQTLAVVRQFRDRLTVTGLAAGRNIAVLLDQILEFRPTLVSVQTESDRIQVLEFVGAHAIPCQVAVGEAGLCDVATLPEADLVIMAITGTACLPPVIRAIKAKKTIGIACKEALVAAGTLVMEMASVHGVALLPIDSEHAALAQCLAGIRSAADISTLILTASGGPFWNWTPDAISQATVADALAHPNWAMGSKISVDSATMMNKGLEVIEAHHLFGVPFDQISVVVHPTSIAHSAVEFIDGTVIMQLSSPDMRIPIQYVLSYPEKWRTPWKPLVIPDHSPLYFYQPNNAKFPMLELAISAGRQQGTAPVVMNAANEAAVAQFLAGQISFGDIYRIVETAVSTYPHVSQPSLDEIIHIDRTIKTQLNSHAV